MVNEHSAQYYFEQELKSFEDWKSRNFELYTRLGSEINGYKRFREQIIAEAVEKGSIGFANWLQFNYQPHAETGYWYNHHDVQSGLIPLTTEQLYQEYIKSLTNG